MSNDQSYHPLCVPCEEDGIETLATEERHGEPYCSSCATARDEQAWEASLSDFYGGSGPQTARERSEVDAMNQVRR